MLATVPFSAVGAILLFHLLGYNVSIAAWVGMIALLGLDAETAVFMLLFLDLSWDDAKRRGLLLNEHEVDDLIRCSLAFENLVGRRRHAIKARPA